LINGNAPTLCWFPFNDSSGNKSLLLSIISRILITPLKAALDAASAVLFPSRNEVIAMAAA
jgi:hypothetical protein